MVVRKTHRRRQTKRKTIHHRRRTVRHRKGGGMNMSMNIHNNEDVCSKYLRKLSELRNKLNTFTVNTVEEELYGKVRALYDDAKRAGCNQNLLDKI